MSDTWYRGDLKPDLELTLTDGDDGPTIDLSAATTVKVIGARPDGTVVFNRAATSTTAEGVVTLVWEPGDTAEVGPITVEVQITWPGEKRQTIRIPGVILIVADLAD